MVVVPRGKRRAATVLGVVALTAPLALVSHPAAAADPLSLPTFGVRATGLAADQAERLARAFGLKQVAREEDGSVRFATEDAYSVPTRTVGRGRDEDGHVTTSTVLNRAALARVRTISAKSALQRAARALAAADLVPDGGRAGAGNTRVTTVDRRGRTTASVALDTTVTYAFTLAGLPYQGPGAKVRVAFAGEGAVTSLSYSTRALAQTGSVKVLDTGAALQRCSRVLGDSVLVKSASPIYYAPALAEKLSTLEPSFRCVGVTRDGSPAQIVTVPAAVDAVLPAMLAAPPDRPKPTGVTGRAYGRVDVGSEGTGPCSGLPHTGANLASFNNQFSGRGIPVEFSWLDQNAWEQDFKDPSKGGDDSNWTDHVDLAYWQGHGAPTGFSFAGCSSNDDTFLANTDARWGNGDVEWMSLFTCLILEAGAPGDRWWQRWGPAFDGLHQINSFHTVSWHSAKHGGIYANYMLRNPFLWWNKPMSVRHAWAQASIDDQPPGVVWASMGVLGAGGMVNLNDYFWGKGPVGPDVPASGVTGYWYVSGLS
jgi:hypothetical protein